MPVYVIYGLGVPVLAVIAVALFWPQPKWIGEVSTKPVNWWPLIVVCVPMLVLPAMLIGALRMYEMIINHAVML